MTMTTHHSPTELPNWHSTFAAAAEVASATVHARGTLDLFTVDLLQGAIDVLTAAGCTDITLDLAEVGSVDHAAAWCIAETSSTLASRHGQLTIANARDTVLSALGELHRAPPRSHNSGPGAVSRRTPEGRTVSEPQKSETQVHRGEPR
ncbi:MAG: hypothetical protein DLM58_18015 [Pseudonocardiales bacterium]|nr:MAG: hypothetical protein DLM58_18015 [Pseudonocardiales bacterium]